MCEATQKVRAILCRGASFPATAPKPIVAELAIQVSSYERHDLSYLILPSLLCQSSLYTHVFFMVDASL